MKTCKQALKEPDYYANGQCRACSGGWKCSWHIEQDAQQDRKLSATLKRVCSAIRANEIGLVCASLELESNELETRERQAAQVLGWSQAEIEGNAALLA